MKALIEHEIKQGLDKKGLVFLPLDTQCVVVSVLYDKEKVWFGDVTFFTALRQSMPTANDSRLMVIELPDETGADLLKNYHNGPSYLSINTIRRLRELVIAHRQTYQTVTAKNNLY